MSSLTAHAFACAMQAHWTATEPHGLNNVTSPKLMSLWTAMGRAFISAIEASEDPTSPDRHLWRILRPETGTGKTQGVRIFSAMVAEENLQLPVKERTGVLIVTRQTDEADKLAEEINTSFWQLTTESARAAGKEWYAESLYIEGVHRTVSPADRSRTLRPIAVAKHSKLTGRVKKEAVEKTPILILTHASYVAALDRLEQAEDDRWSSMINWKVEFAVSP